MGVIPVLQVADGPDLGHLPAGLLHVRRLAEALSRLDVGQSRNLRVVLTVPTLRLAGVAAALGATLAGQSCSDCSHTQLEVGAPVTGWRSGAFVDAPLDAMNDETLMFGGIRLRGHRDCVHHLPEAFPDRPDWRLPDDLRTDVAAALGCDEALAGQRLSAAAAHPVIVAGEPSAFRADVEELAAASPDLHLRGRLHSGGLGDWFRHPVLVMGGVPQPEDIPWARDLRPRLIVITGSAGWAGSSRTVWPDAPVLVLLPRRSPAAREAASLICASGWAAPDHVPTTLEPLLLPTAGLEILCAVEPEAASEGEDVW